MTTLATEATLGTYEKVTRLGELFAAGMTYRQAAAELGVPRRTVEYYAAMLRQRQRRQALASARISWPLPSAPVPGAVRWQDRAACRGHGDLFHAPDREVLTDREIREAKAKSLCRACPVRSECLEDAFTSNDKWGVRGGLGEDERGRERQRWLRARRAVA